MKRSKEVESAIGFLRKEAFWSLHKSINYNVLMNYVTKLEEENKADKAEIRLLKDIIKDCEKDNISKEKIREKKAIVEKKLRKLKARRSGKSMTETVEDIKLMGKFEAYDELLIEGYKEMEV